MPNDQTQPDAAAKPNSKPRRTKKRLLVYAALLLLFFAVLTPLGVVYWYTRPAQLVPFVEEALFESTGCLASIDTVAFTTDGDITLQGVTLRVPGAAGPFATFMTVDRIEMQGSLRQLLDGGYRPTRIDLIEPVLHLTEQVDTGLFNYELLSAPQGGSEDVPIPIMTIQDGKIRFDQLVDGRIETLGEMGVAGELKPDPAVPKGYTFAITETDAPDGVENISFTGGFDLKAPSVDMRAMNFRFSDEQRYFVPGEFRAWWSRLSPTGEVPELDLSMRPNEQGLLDLDVVRLKLVDVGLNLDLLDLGDPAQQDIAILLHAIQTRMTQVTGEVEVDDQSFRLKGMGRIEQSGIGLSPIVYNVTADGGLNEGDPFKVEFDTDPFVLSEAYQYGLAFIPITREGYQRFLPSGTFELNATLESTSGVSDVDWRIDLGILDGKMAHAMFPVPLENVKGNVRIAPQRVQIGPLTAKSINGASIVLDGFAQPASDIAEVKLDIHIKDMPIDQVLRDALEPDVQENIERFFNRAMYDRLVERGTIAPHDVDDSDLPRFTLGGTCDLFVPVHRPFGEDADYSVVPVLQAKGLSLLMEDFPYPVTAQRGEVTLGPDFVIIEDLHLVSPTGGQMTLNGSAKKGDDGEYRPLVELSDAKMPIDTVLLAALGEEAEALLTDLNVTGGVELSGELFQGPQAVEPDLAFDVKVVDATTTPYGGRVKVEDVQGTIKLRAEGIDKLDLSGTYGSATVGIAGSVDWSDIENTTAALTFTPRNMTWGPELVDVLPPGNALRGDLAELFEEYQPAGGFDATIDWQSNGADQEDGFGAVVTPKTLAFNLLGGRLDFTDMTGRVLINEQLMQLDQLKGTFVDAGQPGGTGTLEASGDIGFDSEPTIGLIFTGRAHTASETARLLLPDGAINVIDSIKLRSTLDLKDAQLNMTHTGGETQTTGFDGVFKLMDTTMNIAGLEVTDFDGTLEVEVQDDAEPGLPLMVYGLAIDQMKVTGRQVENFVIKADNRANRAVLRSNRGEGTLYNGTAVLEASMDLGGDASEAGGVRLCASIHDVELTPLIKPQEPWQAQADRRVVQRDDDTGLVSASLMLDSSYEPDGPRYGRGNMRFNNARLLSDTQVGLVLLQAMSLKLPDRRGFDQGEARFDIQGNTLTFRSLSLENRGLHLSAWGRRFYEQGTRLNGRGTITFPEAALDLRITTASTGTASRLPFSELLDGLLNELASYRVTGTLTDPKVRYQVLRGTRDAIGGSGKAN